MQDKFGATVGHYSYEGLRKAIDDAAATKSAQRTAVIITGNRSNRRLYATAYVNIQPRHYDPTGKSKSVDFLQIIKAASENIPKE